MHTIQRAAMALLFATLPTIAAAQPAAPLASAEHVSEAELRAHIAYLASDELEGRLPGTPGETLTAHYIAQQFYAAGFVGAMPDGGWYQPVPLVQMTAGTSAYRFDDGRSAEVPLRELVLRAPSGEGAVDAAQLVFAGHGVGADGAVPGDVRGKVVLLLIADPAGDNPPNLQARRDAVIAAGARATLLIPPAAAPFAALQRNFTSGRMQLAERVSRAEVEGVLSYAAAQTLFAAADTDLAVEIARAATPDFAVRPLAIRVSLAATTPRRDFNSYNIVARLPGRVPASGAVLMTGHWDHLGLCRPDGAADRICNGAVDNASGIAVMLASARRLGSGARPDRDIVMVATTAEEQGLLGAYHFVAHPLMLLRDIQVVLNVDTVAIAPRGAAVDIVGKGTTDFDPIVEQVARSLGRDMIMGDAANAFIRRQDGWAFTQAGVPALMAGGSFADQALLETFLEGPYHEPEDELTEALPLGGAADDADLHILLARRFGSVTQSPRRVRD